MSDLAIVQFKGDAYDARKLDADYIETPQDATAKHTFVVARRAAYLYETTRFGFKRLSGVVLLNQDNTHAPWVNSGYLNKKLDALWRQSHPVLTSR